MYLKEILDNLLIGELRQIGTGLAIEQGDYSKVVPSINMALNALHRRFSLLTDDVYVNQYDHISTYYLKDEFRVTNTGSTELIKYIDDTQFKPFDADRLIKVISISNELGEELYINNDNEVHTVFMPGYNIIQTSAPVGDNTWRVIYTKDHAKILTTDLDPTTQVIELPSAYLEPLLYYIAARHHSGSGTLNQVNEANVFLAKYEAACNELERFNLVQKDEFTNSKLEDRGWV